MARKLAHGTKLKLGDGASSETFATVAYLDTISLPSSTRGAVDVSDHDTEDAMEFLAAALFDGGSVGFGGHLDPTAATQGYSAGTGIIGAFQDGGLHNWQIESPDAVWQVAFAGIITAQGGDANSESGAGKLRITGEIKVSGKPTYEAVGA
jgi:hypothetical protein